MQGKWGRSVLEFGDFSLHIHCQTLTHAQTQTIMLHTDKRKEKKEKRINNKSMFEQDYKTSKQS